MSTTTTKVIDLTPTIKLNAIITSTPPDSQHHNTTTNSRPTVIFLHFWGGSARTWSLVTPLISSKGNPTVCLDLRGWGDSSGPSDADAYSIASLADDVEAAISSLGIDSFVLVGLSMGAKVTQLVAARNSNKGLRGLVLVSPAPPTPLSLPPDMREQQLHAYDGAESATFVATNVLTASFRQPGRELPGFVIEDMLRGNEWAKRAWPAYAMAEDVSKNVDKVMVPVLVLAAEADVVEPVERVRKEVFERYKAGGESTCKLEILPGSGHLSPLDVPEAVAEHVLGFLSAL
ncbi:Alpha/Beta hydrolase protein [Apodospora peruviana]|uniref:Alpha/Beta hydrolase protein n=1 Tax=Apodospora peruviana TaxID=516989 RepID=A0AAE0IJC5_9PEZI|nr:Alpha/Beta hydrolase protein [Apodospora peruviana]